MGSPFGFSFISKGSGCLVGVLPEVDGPPSTRDNYAKLKTITDAVKFASHLSILSSKIIHSSNHFKTYLLTILLETFLGKNSEISTLLSNLSEKVTAWSQLLSRLSANCLKYFSKHGTLNFGAHQNGCCQFKDLCRTLLELHFAFIEAVSFRCFSDIQLEYGISFVSQIQSF